MACASSKAPSTPTRFVHPDEQAAWQDMFRETIRSKRTFLGAALSSDRCAAARRVTSRRTPAFFVIARAARSACSASTGTSPRKKQAKEEISRQATEIKEAQERFQRAVSGTQDALFEFNLQTGEIWHSPQFRKDARLRRRRERNDEGRPEAFVHPDDGAIVGRGDERSSAASHSVRHRISSAQERDGDWLWVRSRRHRRTR